MFWTIKNYPIIVAKDSIAKWPIFGYFASYPGFSSVFVKRAGTKEEMEELVRIFGQVQEDCFKKQERSLVTFPDGCTTNNTELINSKRGAFYYLHSV